MHKRAISRNGEGSFLIVDENIIKIIVVGETLCVFVCDRSQTPVKTTAFTDRHYCNHAWLSSLLLESCGNVFRLKRHFAVSTPMIIMNVLCGKTFWYFPESKPCFDKEFVRQIPGTSLQRSPRKLFSEIIFKPANFLQAWNSVKNAISTKDIRYT